MNVFYEPVRLSEMAGKISRMFPTEGKIVKPGEMDDTLKRLIEILVGLKPHKVKAFGEQRSRAEISSIAGYVCGNSLKVKRDNIFDMLMDFASEDDWGLMFENWQNFFMDKELAEFFCDGLVSAVNFSLHCMNNNFRIGDMDWITDENVVLSLCEKCRNVSDTAEFESELSAHGVLMRTLLGKTCGLYFLLVCPEKVYLETGEQELCDYFDDLLKDEKVVFILNFVRVMNMSNLVRHRKLGGYIRRFAEDNKIVDQLYQTLKDNELWVKYRSWMAKLDIMEGLEGDPDRIEFWFKYTDSMLAHPILSFQDGKDILVMEFENYVVTEFKEKAGGKAYIFQKDEFYKTIQYKIQYRKMAEFKHYIFNYPPKGFCQAMSHLPPDRGWWYPFRMELKKYDIRQ